MFLGDTPLLPTPLSPLPCLLRCPSQVYHLQHSQVSWRKPRPPSPLALHSRQFFLSACAWLQRHQWDCESQAIAVDPVRIVHALEAPVCLLPLLQTLPCDYPTPTV